VPKLTLDKDAEPGHTMLIALMTFMIISLLGTIIVEVGNMEYKSSHYDCELQKAQQAADAGVAWATESIYLQLREAQNQPDIPASFDLQPDSYPQVIGSNPIATKVATYEISNWQAVRISEERSNPAVYEFITTGHYGNAHRTIRVEGAYWYANASNDSNSGPAQGRDYSSIRGYICSYSINK